MANDKTITYAIEQLEGVGEAFEMLPHSPVILSGELASDFAVPDAEETGEPDVAGKQVWDVDSNPPYVAAEITSSYPATHTVSDGNTGIFTSFEKMPSHWWPESDDDDAHRDAARHVSASPAASIQNMEQPSEARTKIIPFPGMASSTDITGDWSNQQESFPVIDIAGETPSSGIPGRETGIRIGYPEDEEKNQAMMDLFQHIASFSEEKATGQPDESRIEEIMRMITGVIEDNKVEKKGNENPYAANPFSNNTGNSTFPKNQPDIEGYIESVANSISNSSEAVRNIHININDGLINGLQNYFNSGNDDLATDGGFTGQVAESLRMVLQKAVYEVG